MVRSGVGRVKLPACLKFCRPTSSPNTKPCNRRPILRCGVRVKRMSGFACLMLVIWWAAVIRRQRTTCVGLAKSLQKRKLSTVHFGHF